MKRFGIAFDNRTVRASGNLIKFLAIILVLTLVARGTSAATLPRVDVTEAEAAEIVERVEGSAMVTASGSLDVLLPEGLSLKDMLVAGGQVVEAEEALAEFDIAEVRERLAREKVNRKDLALKLKQLGRSEPIDDSALKNAQRDLSRAKKDASEAKAQGAKDVKAGKKALAAAEKAETLARQRVDKAAAAEKAEAKKALQEAVQQVSQAKSALTQAQSKQKSDDTSAARRVEDAKASLAKAQKEYEKSAQQTSDTNTKNQIDAELQQLDMDKLDVTIGQLEELDEADGILKAPAAGVVAKTMQLGMKTDGNAVVQIYDGEKGFEAEMTISATDAEKISAGDTCDVAAASSSMYFRQTESGTVSWIAEPDEEEKVKVGIQLPEGEWTQGQMVDAQVAVSRANYGSCIPLAALHSDNSGYFVYTVTEKKTVLGIENVVKRVNVELVSKDETNAAIEGAMARDEQIITASNKTIEADSRVRVNQDE